LSQRDKPHHIFHFHFHLHPIHHFEGMGTYPGREKAKEPGYKCPALMREKFGGYLLSQKLYNHYHRQRCV
jgi:hypothetical protein